MTKNNKALYLLGLAIPLILVFKSLFMPGPLAWGDAPHYFPNELSELLSIPAVWTERGHTLGGVNQVLWLVPLMYLYGLVGSIVGNDLAIRLLFYFPAILLSVSGSVLLAKQHKLKLVGQFFAALVYLFNTYFILLMDGGQVGLALAYGLFPWTVLYLIKLLDKPTKGSFSAALLSVFLITLVDPRIAAIANVYTFLFFVINSIKAKSADLKAVTALVVINIFNIALNSYWLVPLLKISGSAPIRGAADLQLTSVLNGLTLHQPHWPENIFGQVTQPSLFGALVLLLITFSILKSRTTKLATFSLVFLILTLFVNGETPPLGYFYTWMMNKIPLSASFRDSTKYFIPLTLTAGLLIGGIIDKIKNKLFTGFVYVVILGSVSSAIFGQMNFVLSDRMHSNDIIKIHTHLSSQANFGRTVWIPEHHPLATQTISSPAVDGKDLVNLRPLGRLNAGTFDRFNYLHTPGYVDYYKIFGINSLVLSGDPRTVQLNEQEVLLWEDLNQRIATSSGLVRINLDTQVPVYEVPGTLPHVYSVETLYAVIGSDNIFDNVNPIGQPAIYFEDGQLDHTNLEGLAPESVKIVFNNKNKSDLVISFLQDYFISPHQAHMSEWANRSSEEYLRYKYELLINGVTYNEFDYGKGLAFSTRPGETITFRLNAPASGQYILAIRSLAGGVAHQPTINFLGDQTPIQNTRAEVYQWFTKELNVSQGEHELAIKSSGSTINVVNVVALVPKQKFTEATREAQALVSHFGTVDTSELSTEPDEIIHVDFSEHSPTRYSLSVPESGNWLIFSDTYHPDWKIKQGDQNINSVPAYSTINAFYFEPDWPSAEITFTGQKYVRYGAYLSIATLITLAIAFLWTYPDRKQ